MNIKEKFLNKYFDEIATTSKLINLNKIDEIIKKIKFIKQNKGRIFFIGVGGSSANASHAVNDFRKICSIECYNPLDNFSEISARINDEGWESSISEYLKTSNLSKNDALFFLSVGGGDIKKKISVNLINALKYGKKRKSNIFAIVARKEGYIYKNNKLTILIPIGDRKNITPISESFQSVILHAIVSDTRLQENKTKW